MPQVAPCVKRFLAKRMERQDTVSARGRAKPAPSGFYPSDNGLRLSDTWQTRGDRVSRIIQQPCHDVRTVPDADHGTRPERIRWYDRRGDLHQLHIAGTCDTYMTTGLWWEHPKGHLCERRYWRVELRPVGVAILYEDLERPPGAPDRWWIDRIED